MEDVPDETMDEGIVQKLSELFFKHGDNQHSIMSDCSHVYIKHMII